MHFMRAFALIGVLGFAFFATGCSGHSGGVTPPVASNQGAVPMPNASTTGGSGITTMSTTSGVPTHVQTGTYLWSSTEMATSPSKYAPYLTYAYAKNSTQAAAIQSAGIKSLVYTNPIMPNHSSYDLTELTSAYGSDIATNCSGSKISVFGHTGYMSDPRKSGTASYFNNIVSHDVGVYGGHADYVFVDNASSYGYNVDNGPPCGATTTSWGSAIDASVAGVGHKVILNNFSVSLANVPTFVQYLKGSNVAGGMWEECYNTPSQWYATEEGELLAVALVKSEGKPAGPGFWCYRDITSTAGSSVIPERIFDYASFLLTYDPNYSVFEESFTTTPSTFQVFPETGFVALQPQIAATHYTDLKSSTGAYVQRFGACYYRGSLVGSCEVAVNPNTSGTVSVPNASSYPRSMTLSGGGVLDGGTASFSGSTVTSLGPQRAAILINPSGGTSGTSTGTTTTTASSTSSWSGKVIWMGNYSKDGSFEVSTSAGNKMVYPESYTTWTNRSSIAVGVSVAIGGYINNNGNIIASSINVGATTASTTTVATTSSGTSWNGTVSWMGNFSSSGGFQMKTSSGYVGVYSEPSTSWTNKSALAVGRSVSASGYKNNNGAIIASSIDVL